MTPIVLPSGSGRAALRVTPLLFINNAFVAAQGGQTFKTLNPANEQFLCDVANAQKVDVDAAVTAAQTAFSDTWRNLKPATRGRHLRDFAAALIKFREPLALSMTLDTGKTYADSIAEVDESASILEYYAGWADKIVGTADCNDPAFFSYTRREPWGVVGLIIPWNYPILIAAWKIAPALACGNTVVVKTSELSPLSGCVLAEAVLESGLPAGVLNVLTGLGVDAGAPLAAHMGVRKVAFTGSPVTAKAILKAAADSNMKKVSLELGGKGPFIVCEDADLEQAAYWANVGINCNAGQSCSASTRFFVHAKVYDEFLSLYTAHVKSPTMGDPLHDDTTLGPLVSKQQFDKVMEYIESARQEGAHIAFGGSQEGDVGYFVQPTLLTDVPLTARVVREEIFGPVACMFKWEDEGEVIKVANDTEYGLAASVFTRDLARAHRMAAELEVGTVWVNECVSCHPGMPFGGFKQSGFGRDLGEDAVREYTQTKAIKVSLATGKP